MNELRRAFKSSLFLFFFSSHLMILVFAINVRKSDCEVEFILGERAIRGGGGRRGKEDQTAMACGTGFECGAMARCTRPIITSTVASKSYSLCQPQSALARESSIESGHESAEESEKREKEQTDGLTDGADLVLDAEVGQHTADRRCEFVGGEGVARDVVSPQGQRGRGSRQELKGLWKKKERLTKQMEAMQSVSYIMGSLESGRR